MGKISDRLQVHPASVTSAVKRLERDGLISRTSDHIDNRIVLAAILPEGREVLDPATEAVNEIFTTIGLAEPDLEALIGLMDPIRSLAGDPVASSEPESA